MSFENIPEELKERDQWLMWDASADTPRRPHWRGNFAVSWTNPNDWHSFDEAVEAASERESWGIGYVFAKGNDDYPRGIYGALDLDGCAREDGGPKDWLPSLQGFLDAGAYIEYSPSGTGLHIPILGFEEPEWWTDIAVGDDHEGIEAYGSKFFTFTGDTLDACDGDVLEDTGVAEDWLKMACEELTGERPWEPREPEQETVTAPTSLGKKGNVDDIARAIDDLDARDVADKTIVSRWNDSAGTSGDNRAFYPTWGGANCSGTANIVDRDGWVDTGTDSGSGGPMEMAAIDLGIINHSGCSWGDVTGADWWEAVDHLRDLGFRIPEYEGPEKSIQEEAVEPEGDEDAPESSESGSSTTWRSIRSLYADDQTENKYARLSAAHKILSENEFATPRDTGRLWEYYAPDGVFERGGEATVDEILAANLGAHYSQRERNEILGYIRARTFIDRDQFNGGEDERLLCVANGVLDLDTRELHDHSPDYYFIRQLPVEYNPVAEATHVETFLDDITERQEDKMTMLEMVGASLWPSYLKGKFMILFGEGGNGKSIFFDLTTQFLSPENVSGWDLQELGNNRFATSALVGKFANIGGDMDSVKVKNTGVLKTLTGGDVMMVEQKNEPAHEFVNSATLMFGANRPPVIGEASRAVKRRLVPIRLPYEFTEDEDELQNNPNAKPAEDADTLLAGMTTDEEKSGLLNLALDGLDRLRETGDVSLPETQEERLEYYEQFSDPIKEFAIRCLTNEPGDRVGKDEVYSAYKQFAADNDYTNRPKSTFFRQLARTTFDTNTVRAGVDGERIQMLDNAAFTEAGMQYAPSYTDASPAATAAADGGKDEEPAALENLSPGFADVTVTVAEILSAPDWLEGKGHLVDDAGNLIPYKCEGVDALSEASEGDTVHLSNAKMQQTNEGMTAVLSKVTKVEITSRDGDQSPLSAQTSDEDETEEDAEAEAYEWAKPLVGTLKSKGGAATESDLRTGLMDRGIDVSRAQLIVEDATEKGFLVETPDGDLEATDKLKGRVN